ncbi:MAG: hypothetical protein CBC90_00995 [Acidimicrobiaceae bacterium TMED130]|nr:MAG: hypothetical protein CBC90_00995 [Acidimicrobiaceae bacterium TMED130]
MRSKVKPALFVLFSVLLLVTGCTIQLRVKIDVAEDGSGQISAGVGLDQEARNQPVFQNIEEILQTNDLPGSGWIFENTGLGPDGREWFEAKKPFANPEDLQLLLNELTSSPKAFGDWEIISQVTKKNRDYAISGVVDLTDGFELFTDEALDGLLEEPPLGIPIATLEESLGSPIEDAVTLQVVINLPDQNNEEIINIPLGEQRVIEVTGNSEHRVAQILDWVVLAVIALLGLSVILALLNWYLDKRYEEKQLQRRPSPIAQQIPGKENLSPQQSQNNAEKLQLLVIDPYGIIFKQETNPVDHLYTFIKAKNGNIDQDELEDIYQEGTMGRLSTTDLWKSAGLEENVDNLNREYVKSFEFRNGGKDLLRNLHKRGIAVAVVTNDFAEWSNQIREIYGLQGIKPWIVSSDYGVRKPDSAILETLNRYSGVAYQSCLVLDTATNFLDTAQILGMKTVYLNSNNEIPDNDRNHPSVKKLNEFFKRQ